MQAGQRGERAQAVAWNGSHVLDASQWLPRQRRGGTGHAWPMTKEKSRLMRYRACLAYDEGEEQVDEVQSMPGL